MIPRAKMENNKQWLAAVAVVDGRQDDDIIEVQLTTLCFWQQYSCIVVSYAPVYICWSKDCLVEATHDVCCCLPDHCTSTGNEWMNECVRLSLLLCDRPDRSWNGCDDFRRFLVMFIARSLSACLFVCHRCCVVSEWHCSHVIIVFLSKLNAVPCHT